MRNITAALTLLCSSSFALADGHADVEAGEKVFKKCQACHVVQAEDGTVLAGKNGKTGPNLFGLVGMQAGSVEGFKYKKSLVAAGEAGLIWTEELLVQWVQDPSKFLKTYLEDNGARSSMSMKIRKEKDAINVVGFLAQFGAPEE
jgi:cytochrome c